MKFNNQFHEIKRSTLVPAAIAGALVVSVLFTAGVAAQPGSHDKPDGPKPTVVFVHGAFADGSGWSGEVERLQREGYPVIAPANPLRGVSSDAAYVASVLDTVTGPIVLVGHSYGGVVITNAAAMTKNANNIKALVYIAAYIPDVGQAAKDLTPLPGSQIVLPLPGVTAPTVILRPCPPANCGAGFDAYIDPANFRQVFAADLTAQQTAVMAATQRPASLVALLEPSAFAAWKSIPSFALVATADNAIGTANVRAMAQHAGAHIVEVKASHAVLVSQPNAVVRLIHAAAGADD
jgi:pimeloyl-ACP methyl ester carboxylesterase